MLDKQLCQYIKYSTNDQQRQEVRQSVNVAERVRNDDNGYRPFDNSVSCMPQYAAKIPNRFDMSAFTCRFCHNRSFNRPYTRRDRLPS